MKKTQLSFLFKYTNVEAAMQYFSYQQVNLILHHFIEEHSAINS